MDDRVKFVGSIDQDNLIAGLYPPAIPAGIQIAVGQGLLRRGTVLVGGDTGCTMLAAAPADKPVYILTDNIDTTDTTEPVSATGYRCGNFNADALIVAEGYTLTAADQDALRKYDVILTDNTQ